MLNTEVFIYMNEIYSDSAVKIQHVPPINPLNPFNNPTENEKYNSDYADIVPQISIPGCEIPFEPSKPEKKRIRRYFNIAGSWLLIHFAAINILAFLSFAIIKLALSKNASDADLPSIYNYISSSAIYLGMTGLIFLVCNLLTFFFGCKTAKIKISSLFQTESIRLPKMLQYISIAFMLQYLSSLIALAIQYLCPDLNLIANALDTQNMTSRAYIAFAVYSCIIAPITEEFLYRGFVLKTCSRVSQRFGIFMSAVFFGLAHGNVTQFILAFLIGVFMAHIDIKHNSLFPSICVHFCVNTLSTAAGFFLKNDSKIALVTLGIFEIGMFITGIVMLIFFRHKNKLPFTMPHQKMRGGSVAVTSWAIILCFALFLLQFTVNLFN